MSVPPEDTYRSITERKSSELKVRGSRFIADAFPVDAEAQIENYIAGARKHYRDATHHCIAYRLGPGGETFRYNDDGEPAGTAGQPILRQLDACGFTNVLAIVTRYYGGTKLGTGGLSRAYGHAARSVLALCTPVTHVIRTRLHLRFEYADQPRVMRLLETSAAQVERSEYGEAVELIVGVPRSRAHPFVGVFTDRLSGRGTVTTL